MHRLGIVVALKHEAAIVTPHLQDGSTEILISGMGPERAADAATQLVNNGATALLSIGLSGGLDPTLRTSSIVVPRELRRADRHDLNASNDWREKFVGILRTNKALGSLKMSSGATITTTKPVASVADKAALRSSADAAAVDTESYSVADVADRNGAHFLSVRVIADTFDQTLPVELLRSNSEGQVTIPSIVIGLFRHPASIGNLVIVAQQGRHALAALGRVAALAGPRFGL